MARTELTPQDLNAAAGIVDSLSAGSSDGHMMDPNDILVVANGSGSSITVTLQTAETRGSGALAVAEATFTVAAGATRRKAIPKADQSIFARPRGATDAGKVYIDLSAVSSVTIGTYERA